MNLDDRVELQELLEQVNYALSLEFREKWRHKYSETFIKIFQEALLRAFQTQKPLELFDLETQFTKKYHYEKSIVYDFFRTIEIDLYFPIIFRKRKA